MELSYINFAEDCFVRSYFLPKILLCAQGIFLLYSVAKDDTLIIIFRYYSSGKLHRIFNGAADPVWNTMIFGGSFYERFVAAAFF